MPVACAVTITQHSTHCSTTSYAPPLQIPVSACLLACLQVFLVKYPYQELVRELSDKQAAHASIYSMPASLFYDLHPFHLLLDRECRLLQAGAAVKRVAPSLVPGEPIVRHARLQHPPQMVWDYGEILKRGKSCFLVLLREAMVTLKGQMVETTLPGGPG